VLVLIAMFATRRALAGRVVASAATIADTATQNTVGAFDFAQSRTEFCESLILHKLRSVGFNKTISRATLNTINA
jgi:hypothetical protein